MTPAGGRSSIARLSKSDGPAPRHRVEVRINVYDLLPPGRLSNVLWNLGSSMLHSGVVINGKEYAYGGHDKRAVSGVYWTPPEWLPPGGTFRCSILHGFALRSQDEVDEVIRGASQKFLGPEWNLLKQNCNHFTSYLCEQLTGRPAPRWLNRAAAVGIAFPCVVPTTWLSPPDAETADGELVEEEDRSDEENEQRPMLRESRRDRRRQSEIDDDDMSYEGSLTGDERSPPPRREDHRTRDRRRQGRHAAITDSEGHLLPR